MVSRLKNEEYKNWIKCTLGLQIAAETVRPYVAKQFEDFYEQNSILSNPECFNYDGKWYCLPDCPCYRHVYHVLCHPVRWDDEQEEHYMETNCNRCTKAFNLIYNLLEEEHWAKKLRWDNIEFTRVYEDSWAIAQVFMPIGGQMCDTPARTDPLALFRVMMNCTLFNAAGTSELNQSLEKLCHYRNELMHSSSNLVSSKTTQAIFNLLDYILTKNVNTSWKNARKELRKLRIQEMTIEMFDKATSFKIQALQSDIAVLEIKSDECEDKEDPENPKTNNLPGLLQKSLENCCYDRSDEQDKASFREKSLVTFQKMRKTVLELNTMKNNVNLELKEYKSKQAILCNDMNTALNKLKQENLELNQTIKWFKYILVGIGVIVVCILLKNALENIQVSRNNRYYRY